MIKKLFLVIVSLSIYLHVISSGKETTLKDQMITVYRYCEAYVKKMDVQIEVNQLKLPAEQKKL